MKSAKDKAESYPVTADREHAIRFMPWSPWPWQLYKDPKNCRWQSYNKVHGTISRSWLLHGSFDALLMVLGWCWQQVMDAGIVDACPYKEIADIDWKKG